MSWILFVWMLNVDGSREPFRYAEPYSTRQACNKAGHELVAGDGQGEHYSCVPVKGEEVKT